MIFIDLNLDNNAVMSPDLGLMIFMIPGCQG